MKTKIMKIAMMGVFSLVFLLSLVLQFPVCSAAIDGNSNSNITKGLWNNSYLPSINLTFGNGKLSNSYMESVNDILWRMDITVDKMEEVMQIPVSFEDKGKKKESFIKFFKAGTNIPNNSIIVLTNQDKKIVAIKTIFVDGDNKSSQAAMVEMDVMLATLLAKNEEEINKIESTLAQFTGNEQVEIEIPSKKKTFLIGVDKGSLENEFGLVAVEKPNL